MSLSTRKAVLQALRHSPDSCTGAELEAVAGRRFGARILELRRDGHEIESIRPTNGGDWRYRLVKDASYQRAAKATTEGVMPGTSSLSASDSALSSPSAPVLFEVPPVAPRNALLDDEAA